MAQSGSSREMARGAQGPYTAANIFVPPNKNEADPSRQDKQDISHDNGRSVVPLIQPLGRRRMLKSRVGSFFGGGVCGLVRGLRLTGGIFEPTMLVTTVG